MKNISESFKRNGKLHHAYFIEGERKNILEKILIFLEKELGFAVRGNPDFWLGEFDGFGIDESRALLERQAGRAFGGGKKISVIAANFMTVEAQNSLLKIFEEPSEGTHFFVIVPSFEILIPTLKSRAFLEKTESGLGAAKKFEKAAGEFAKSASGRRMEIIKDISEEKDKNSAIDFLGALEKILYEKKDILKENAEIFKQVETCRSYLRGRSPSVKMILEYFASVFPKI